MIRLAMRTASYTPINLTQLEFQSAVKLMWFVTVMNRCRIHELKIWMHCNAPCRTFRHGSASYLLPGWSIV